nr:unnamed protein product [Callosobruchus analis]
MGQNDLCGTPWGRTTTVLLVLKNILGLKYKGVFTELLVVGNLKNINFHNSAKLHEQSLWHKESTMESKCFVDVMSNKQLNCIFCGTRDLSLRGEISNERNFQDLLQFRVKAGDKILHEHLSSSSGKAKYTYFSSYTKHSNIYIHWSWRRQKLSIRDGFLSFTKLKKMDAKKISDEIISLCNNLKIDMKKLYGLGFDGCSAMAGHESGVQKCIRDTYPKALYFHCAPYRLNLTT